MQSAVSGSLGDRSTTSLPVIVVLQEPYCSLKLWDGVLVSDVLTGYRAMLAPSVFSRCNHRNSGQKARNSSLLWS